jgi:hypothetical protein
MIEIHWVWYQLLTILAMLGNEKLESRIVGYIVHWIPSQPPRFEVRLETWTQSDYTDLLPLLDDGIESELKADIQSSLPTESYMHTIYQT